jgi:hypothetical protein
VRGVVVERTFRGGSYRISLRFFDREDLTFEWPTGRQVPEVGERVELSLDPAGLTLLLE